LRRIKDKVEDKFEDYQWGQLDLRHVFTNLRIEKIPTHYKLAEQFVRFCSECMT
jgi:hypothetical protein